MAQVSLTEKLEKGPCFGTFIKIPRPEIVEMLAIVGFDFGICDMEHAQIVEKEARAVVKAGVSVNLPIVVRLPDPTQGAVNRLLEAGAAGIQVPRMKSVDDASFLTSLFSFPPTGIRSVGTANIKASYGLMSVEQYVKSAQQGLLRVGQFETDEISNPLEEIIKLLDVAFIGPVDLGVDLGEAGTGQGPRVEARIREIVEAAARVGKYSGIFVGDVKKVAEYVERGFRYIAVSGDVGMLLSTAKELIRELRGGV